MKTVCQTLVILALLPFSWGQQETPRKKPVLIRADQTTELEAEPEIITPDPAEAKRNLAVGDFYFKKKNFAAAADRYREAVKYGPTSHVAYDKLVQALEKLGAYSEALATCNDYIKNNPESDKVNEFEKKSEKLKTMVES